MMFTCDAKLQCLELFFTSTRAGKEAVELLPFDALLADVRAVFTTCSSSFAMLVVVSSASEASVGNPLWSAVVYIILALLAQK